MGGFRFPLYVRLDDGSMMRIEAMEKILYYLEAIDIENNEYLFWDAGGNGVRVLLTGKVGRFSNPDVSGICAADNPIALLDAMHGWATQLGLKMDSHGTPAQVWEKLQQGGGKSAPRSSRRFHGKDD